jgi:hypothetical protein
MCPGNVASLPAYRRAGANGPLLPFKLRLCHHQRSQSLIRCFTAVGEREKPRTRRVLHTSMYLYLVDRRARTWIISHVLEKGGAADAQRLLTGLSLSFNIIKFDPGVREYKVTR